MLNSNLYLFGLQNTKKYFIFSNLVKYTKKKQWNNLFRNFLQYFTNISQLHFNYAGTISKTIGNLYECRYGRNI